MQLTTTAIRFSTSLRKKEFPKKTEAIIKEIIELTERLPVLLMEHIALKDTSIISQRFSYANKDIDTLLEYFSSLEIEAIEKIEPASSATTKESKEYLDNIL